MPPPWNGRGAVKRGEEVGNTGWALAWCVAYRSIVLSPLRDDLAVRS